MSNNSGIPIINWFDEPIKQSIKSVFKGVNESVEALDIFKKYRGEQFKSVKHSANHLKILGMSAPVKLVDIYYPAFVSTTIHRRLYEFAELHSDEDLSSKSTIPSIKSTNVRADKYVEDTNRVVILGGPGSGKTTLLRYLAYAFCDKGTFKSSELQTSKFPVFIHLPDLAKSKSSLENFIGDELESLTDEYAHSFIKRVLKNGSSIILLDSLDEVTQRKKSETIDKIKKFCRKYPLCSIVLSCRTADYEVVLEDFHEVELARLSLDAIEKIVKAWFGQDTQRAKKLLRHLKNDNAIASLMETPLLLSLLCIQYRNDLSIPTKRKAELFERCIVALLREWDSSRNFRRDTVYDNLSDNRKEQIFKHVASHFF
jgi:predicted NACHT family NTPase